MSDIAARREATLVQANGIEIAFRDVGDGPPLVLLHGGLVSTGPAWAGSSAAHVDHLDALARHFRVIAPDTRGSGATVHPGGPATFDVLADDVVALIGALGLDRPLIAGFSEGGATASYVALRHPGAARAVVIHSGFHYLDRSTEPWQWFRQIFGGSPEAAHVDPDAAERAHASRADAAAVFGTMQADYDEAQGAGYWRAYLGQFFDRHVATSEYTVADLAAITVPTLILAGDRDHFCPVEAACAAYRTLETGQLGIVPNAGHEITSAGIALMIAFLRTAIA